MGDYVVGEGDVGSHTIDRVDIAGGNGIDGRLFVHARVFLLAISRHHILLHHLRRGRGPDDGVGAGGDGRLNRLGRFAARRDEREVGVGTTQLAQYFGCVLAGGDVQDLGAGAHFGMGVVGAHDRRHDGDVHHMNDMLDHLGRGGGVHDHARDALHL